MKFALLILFISLPAVALEGNAKFLKGVTDNTALGMYFAGSSSRCLNAGSVPSLSMLTNTGLLILGEILYQEKSYLARIEQKKIDTEKLKHAQTEESPLGHDGDFQYSMLNRMLAEEMEYEKFFLSSGSYLNALSVFYSVASYYAYGEMDLVESGAIFPVKVKGACVPNQGIKAFAEFITFMPDKEKEVTAKFQSLDSSPLILPENPELRVHETHAMTNILHDLIMDFYNKALMAKSRAIILRKSLEEIRERKLKAKLPPYIYCHSKDVRLFRTEYCEYQVSLDTPEKDWKESNPEWTPFNVLTTNTNNYLQLPVSETDNEGRYVPIIHARNTGLWLPRSVTTLCFNNKRGVFFKIDCKIPVETDNPVQSWTSEKEDGNPDQPVVLALKGGAFLRPLVSSPASAGAIEDIPSKALNLIMQGQIQEATTLVTSVLSMNDVLKDLSAGEFQYRTKINDRRLIQKRLPIDWEAERVKKLNELLGLLAYEKSADKTLSDPARAKLEEEKKKQTVIRQQSAGD